MTTIIITNINKDYYEDVDDDEFENFDYEDVDGDDYDMISQCTRNGFR